MLPENDWIITKQKAGLYQDEIAAYWADEFQEGNPYLYEKAQKNVNDWLILKVLLMIS